MPKFAYSAINNEGVTVEGDTKADSIGDARAHLLSQDLYPTKLAEKRGLLQFELTK